MRTRKFFFILLLVQFHDLSAQIINGYAKVTAVSGTTLTIDATHQSEVSGTGTFSAGEHIIIMQMQDNTIGSTANDATFGSLGSIGSAGLYEVTQLASVTRIGGLVTSVTLENSLFNTYNTGANSSLQIITYPLLGSPDFTTTGILTALAWNGEIGGVLAFRVNGILTLSHNISVNALGFRGGTPNSNPNGAACETTTFRAALASDNGLKGEGIHRNTDANFATSRGKMLNGGGGGNIHNAGGGGGGNFSAGGDGGPGWNSDAPEGCSPSASGQGGIALSSSYASDGSRVFMGGGGGGGQQNNFVATSGGRGGGIILIRATEIRTTGTCGTISVTANGESVALAGNDGGGGGGAGGSIVLQVNTWDIAGTCPILVSSNGGNGGSINSSTHGGGGGGGQGAVFYSIAIPTSHTTTQTNFGIGGCNNSSSPCDYQAPNGAGPNGGGIFGGASTPLPVELIYFRAKKIETNALISWTTQNADIESFDVEKSIGSANAFEPIKKVFAKRDNNFQNYEIWDNNLSPKRITYYRLKIRYNNGKTDYSKIVSLSGENIKENLQIYPNPFKNQFFVVGSEIQKITLTDLSGKVVFEKLCNNTDKEEIQLEKLVQGAYIITVQTNNEIFREKMIHLP